MKRTAILTLVALVLVVLTVPASAYESFFNQRCAECHTDDTVSCNGCHHHGPVTINVEATPVEATTWSSLNSLY